MNWAFEQEARFTATGFVMQLALARLFRFASRRLMATAGEPHIPLAIGSSPQGGRE